MTPTLPAGRYSARKRSLGTRRRTTAIVLVASVLFGALVAVLAYRNFGTEPISGDSLGFSLDNDSTVTVQFSVTRDDPSRPAVCIVRALSRDGSETGRRESYIPPSKTDTTAYTSTVRTSHPPAVGNVFGCSYTVPSYLQPR